MNGASHNTGPRPGGIEIQAITAQDLAQAEPGLQTLLQQARLAGHVRLGSAAHGLRAELQPEDFAAWTPHHDTLALCETLPLDPACDADLEREIQIAMLAAPMPFRFPSLDELVSAVRILALR